MNEDIEKFKRHIGEPTEYEFEDNKGNKDKFMIKPLDAKYLGDLLLASNLSIEIKKGNNSVMGELTEKGIILITATLKQSYPDVSDDILNQFIRKYFIGLLNAIFDVNEFSSKVSKVEEKIVEVKRNIEAEKKRTN